MHAARLQLETDFVSRVTWFRFCLAYLYCWLEKKRCRYGLRTSVSIHPSLFYTAAHPRCHRNLPMRHKGTPGQCSSATWAPLSHLTGPESRENPSWACPQPFYRDATGCTSAQWYALKLTLMLIALCKPHYTQ